MILPPPPWLETPAVRLVMRCLREDGGAARFAGGCVRDALLCQSARDVDIATPLDPEVVMARARAAGLRVTPTGLVHGTVTVIADGQGVEITTLRRDVRTDGRRAVVVFTADWPEDAARRDFTMNALFLDPDGTVFDFVGGVADLHAGRVRFVGDPRRRLAEDSLRLLRFFRFHAWYGRGAPMAEALDACAAMAGLLPRLAVERVRAEMLHLLAAPDPHPALSWLRDCGLFAHLPVPGPVTAADIDRVRRLVWCERAWKIPGDPLRRLAALLWRFDPDLGRGLRLDRARNRRLTLLLRRPLREASPGSAAFYRVYATIGAEATRDAALLMAAAAVPGRWREAIDPALPGCPRLPVNGRDGLRLGIPPGPAVGQALHQVWDWWAERAFRPDRAACLTRLARWRWRGSIRRGSEKTTDPFPWANRPVDVAPVVGVCLARTEYGRGHPELSSPEGPRRLPPGISLMDTDVGEQPGVESAELPPSLDPPPLQSESVQHAVSEERVHSRGRQSANRA